MIEKIIEYLDRRAERNDTRRELEKQLDILIRKANSQRDEAVYIVWWV